MSVRRGFAIALLLAASASACSSAPDTALGQLMKSRRLAADLVVQLTKAAREAERATVATQKDVDALRPVLAALRFTTEARLLDEFTERFSQYQALDRDILGLVRESTNLKATLARLGFTATR